MDVQLYDSKDHLAKCTYLSDNDKLTIFIQQALQKPQLDSNPWSSGRRPQQLFSGKILAIMVMHKRKARRMNTSEKSVTKFGKSKRQAKHNIVLHDGQRMHVAN